MNTFALALYGLINGGMVVFYLVKRGRMYEFPFWFGLISMGWFFPQAWGGLSNIEDYPNPSFSSGMFFASLCSLALWIGFSKGLSAPLKEPTWLTARYDADKLFRAGAVLSVIGFFFYWKLMSLPEEMLAQTQWSGATVKYSFFSSLFKLGFIVLWLVYLQKGEVFSMKFLVVLLPSLLLLLDTAILHGRRAGMMNLFSYIFIGLWFARRIALPRWVLVFGVVMGLILVNAIGMYRAIMEDSELSTADKLKKATKADYISSSDSMGSEAGPEFNNYIYYRHAFAETKKYDWGLKHWNMLVFNYVPGQLVGYKLKNSLMYKQDYSYIGLAKERYGHTRAAGSGTTLTGYFDAFASFSWLGFLKFLLVGWMLGVLYRHAMSGFLLGQLLYIISISTGMHAVSHGTHQVMCSQWVYFFTLGYPFLCWAGIRSHDMAPVAGHDPAQP